MKKRLALLLALTMALSILAGCGPAASTPTTGTTTASTSSSSSTTTASSAPAEDYSETGTLNLLWFQAGGTDGKIECTYRDWQSFIPDLLWDTLIKYEFGNPNNIVPRLASEWSVSPDGLTYTFTIRDEAKWQDGEPVTAEDFLFSFQMLCRGGFSYSGFIAIDGLEAYAKMERDDIPGIIADGKKLTLKLSYPNALIIKHLTGFVAYPKHLFPADLDPAQFENADYFKAPVGNGPYKFESAQYPDFVILTRWDDYYGEKAGIKTLKFQSYGTGGAEAVAAAMIAGELDWADGNELNDITFAKNIAAQNPDYQYSIVDALYTRVFMFNQAGSQDGKVKDQWKDPRVKQAINLLLDKEAIASFYAGQATPMTTQAFPGSIEYNTDIPYHKRDVEAAKKLLDEAGWDYNHVIRLTTHYADQTTADVMDLVIQNLSEAGLKAEFNLATGDLVAAFYDVRNYDILYGAAANATVIENYGLMTTGLAYDKYWADIDTRKTLFTDLYNEYLASTDSARQLEILKQLQANQMEYGAPVSIYALNKVVTYNAKKWSFDPRWLETNELALHRFSDLGIQYWRLNSK